MEVLHMDYTFLYSEVWWMETIIGALIGAAATIIAAVILYNVKFAKMADNIKDIKDGNKELSGEHKELSGEHKELSNQISNGQDKLVSQGLIINDNVKNLHHYVEINEARKNALTGKELDVKKAVETLNVFVDLLAEQKAMITQLQNENKSLHHKINQYQQSKQQFDEDYESENEL